MSATSLWMAVLNVSCAGAGIVAWFMGEHVIALGFLIGACFANAGVWMLEVRDE